MNDCFAARERLCLALTTEMRKCPGEKCKFYKTKEQQQRDARKALKRISKLPATQRQYIEDTYFKKKG